MRCTICSKKISKYNYAVFDKKYHCLPCFLQTYGQTPLVQTEYQSCGSRPLSLSRTNSRQSLERFGSTTSLNSKRPSRLGEAARRFSTTISNGFRQQRSSSAASIRANTNHQKPPLPPLTKGKQTCQVCFEEKSSRHFRPISNHQCRQAERTICNACIYQHIAQSFQEMFTDDVRCPELQCNTKYDYEAVRSILLTNKNTELFDRYDHYVFVNQLEQSEEFIWCSNPKCQMGQLNAGGIENNIVTCTRCHKKTCFKHKIPWHRGLTCDEFDATTEDNVKASLRWLNQNTKTCPNCPYQIEKNDGCDHMTCIKCHHEFCWACLANYDAIRREGNHRHHPECKHYAAYKKR